MKCPYGDHELKLRPPVEHNVLCYGDPATASTLCCGKGVRVSRITSISVSTNIGTARTEDDWGHPIKSHRMAEL